jgi:hypothetical protein
LNNGGPAPQADKLELGRDRLRETVKWLIAGFGAIGASLALGTQISGLGKLDGWRLFAALVGAAIGFAGILVAMFFAVRVQIGAYATLGELVAESRKAKAPESKSGVLRFLEDDNP